MAVAPETEGRGRDEAVWSALTSKDDVAGAAEFGRAVALALVANPSIAQPSCGLLTLYVAALRWLSTHSERHVQTTGAQHRGWFEAGGIRQSGRHDPAKPVASSQPKGRVCHQGRR